MSEIHTNIDDAVICGNGLNIVSGDTGSDLLGFARQAPNIGGMFDYPEGENSSRSIREYFERIRSELPGFPFFIVTRSLFVMREAHMLQREHGYPVRWFYLKADGSFYQADSMDDIRECEELDEEIRQAERYINLENGLKPREQS